MVQVIAECCQNHLGDWALLKDMIWAAADAGATMVKIQSMLPDELAYRERFEEGLIVDGQVRVVRRPYEAELSRMKQASLSDDMHVRFIEECRNANVEPLTTAFAQSRIPFLASLPWKSIKVASYDCASLPMVKTLAEEFDHLFISTGATYDHEIAATARLLEGKSFTFLHCVTIYPTPLDSLHLARMTWLRQFTSSVGFSDHTLTARDGVTASLAAVYLGADVVERHFTLLPPDKTKDGPVSVGPQLLNEIVRFLNLSKDEQGAMIRQRLPALEAVLGVAERTLSIEEEVNRDYYRGRFGSHIGGKLINNWESLQIGRSG